MTATTRGLKLLLAAVTFAAASSMSLHGTAAATAQDPVSGPASTAESVASEAQPSAPDCTYGNFCVYDPWGNKIVNTASNWSGSMNGGVTYFNNGKPMPGNDHVYVKYSFDGKTMTRCVHYGDPDGIGSFDKGRPVTIREVRWGTECQSS